MMLKQNPPRSIAQKLQTDESVQTDDLLLCTDTDIDPQGNYETQWLAVSDSRLWVMTNGSKPQVHFSLDLENASEFRCQGVIGSGLLQARVGDMYVDVLRYSNRLA